MAFVSQKAVPVDKQKDALLVPETPEKKNHNLISLSRKRIGLYLACGLDAW